MPQRRAETLLPCSNPKREAVIAARRGSGGFTFLELAVVVVIMGIVMAITLPRFTGTFSRATLGGAARGLAGTMVYIRDAAARHGRSYFLDIDLENNKYSVTYIDEEADWSEIAYQESEFPDEEMYSQFSDSVVSETVLQKKVSFLEIMLADGTEVSEGVVRIEFRPDGTADEVVIHLTNPKEKVYSVYLEHYNGQPTVYRANSPDQKFVPPYPPVLTERESPTELRDEL